jgi:hypothetical protein
MMAVPLAVLTGPRDIGDLCVRKGTAIGYLVNPHPEVLGQSGVCILFSEGYVIFRHTGYHAGPATCTFIQVYDHAVLVLRVVTFLVSLSFFVLSLFHGYPFLDN